METFYPEESPCSNEEDVTVLPCSSKLTSLCVLDIGWGAEYLNIVRGLSGRASLRVQDIGWGPEYSIRVPNLSKLTRLKRLHVRHCEWDHTISKNVDKVIRDFGFREETLAVAVKVGQDLSSKASWAAYAEFVFRKSGRVLYGDSYHEGSPSKEDATQPGNSRRLKERREFFANLGSVEELKDFIFNMKRVLHFVLGSRSTFAEFLNFSVSEEFRSSLLDAMASRNWEEVESMVMPIAAALPRRAAIYEAFIFLASLLLSVVFQYLIGLVEKGGTKTHSSGSLEFRSRYISTVLFLGAYIWIKFREVAPLSLQKPSPGIYRKSKLNDLGVREYNGNFEPRFKPPGSDSYISVGSYELEQDARIIYQILAFYYGRADSGELPLLNGSTYHIPRMTEGEQVLDGDAKKGWVRGKAKDVLKEYNREFESLMLGCLLCPQQGQVSGDISNTLPPDAGAGSGGQPTQLDNQNDGLVPPNVDPGMQNHVVDDSCNDDAVGGPGVGNESPLGPQFQRHDLEENQVNNMNSDGLGILRSVKDLQRQQQLDQFRIQQLESQQQLDQCQIQQLESQQQRDQFQIQQLESQQQLDQFRIQQLESRLQQQESQIQQQGSQIQQQETQISGLVRDQQLQVLHMQQQVSRILELEGEVERLRSIEPARKRICVGLSLRHDSQN